MTSLETFQVPKPRYDGQDHGTRGTGGAKYDKQQRDYAHSSTTTVENNAHFDGYLEAEAINSGIDEYIESKLSDLFDDEDEKEAHNINDIAKQKDEDDLLDEAYDINALYDRVILSDRTALPTKRTRRRNGRRALRALANENPSRHY
ncbi:MAG: hypothetical protein JWN75_892 [Candidatus Saccharibacteria bacterium]|nr:hypothetical protein [Candidatus Saccharibacteria bacterium]